VDHLVLKEAALEGVWVEYQGVQVLDNATDKQTSSSEQLIDFEWAKSSFSEFEIFEKSSI